MVLTHSHFVIIFPISIAAFGAKILRSHANPQTLWLIQPGGAIFVF